MDKDTAYNLMNNGKKVTNVNFEKHQYLYMDTLFIIRDENGEVQENTWDQLPDNDWSLYNGRIQKDNAEGLPDVLVQSKKRKSKVQHKNFITHQTGHKCVGKDMCNEYNTIGPISCTVCDANPEASEPIDMSLSNSSVNALIEAEEAENIDRGIVHILGNANDDALKDCSLLRTIDRQFDSAYVQVTVPSEPVEEEKCKLNLEDFTVAYDVGNDPSVSHIEYVDVDVEDEKEANILCFPAKALWVYYLILIIGIIVAAIFRTATASAIVLLSFALIVLANILSMRKDNLKRRKAKNE